MTPDESKIMFDMSKEVSELGKHMIAVDGKISSLCKGLAKITDGEGVNRCAVHGEKLSKLESMQGTIVKGD